MANQEHLDILKQGVEVWNQWRKEHTDIQPDLSFANLNRADLSFANLSEADLRQASLSEATLRRASLRMAYLRWAHLYKADLRQADLFGAYLSWVDLSEANLQEANLFGVYLKGADLSRADLKGADLGMANFSWTDIRADHGPRRSDMPNASVRYGANLEGADLRFANLSGADLSVTNLSGTNLHRADFSWANISQANFSGANLTNCYIYATSAWDIKLEGTIQSNLIIRNPDKLDEPVITVDNLKVAQFIYLLLNNEEIRDIIDTITSKVVLILGRFTPERKAVLDALREELRKHNYSPVLFDFEKPASRDLTGTISTLAHLARFIIVDLTDPSSAPHEVATVIPHTIVPVQPLLLRELLVVDGKEGERRAYSMFKDLQRRYHWVLPTYTYTDQAHLLATLQEHVIAPAEQKVQELEKR